MCAIIFLCYYCMRCKQVGSGPSKRLTPYQALEVARAVSGISGLIACASLL